MTPSRTLLLVTLALTVLGLIAAYLTDLHLPWMVLSSTALGATMIDGWLARKLPNLEIKRTVHHSIPMGEWSKIKLRIENCSPLDLHILLHDHHPSWFEVENMPYPLGLPRNRTAEINYRVKPSHRGDGEFGGCDLLITSPMGLWIKKHFITLPEQVKVFPNFREINRYALLATDHRLSQMGVKRRQRRGEGNDFHQLREYHAGDPLRQIDWKASSRYRRLISKEYQDERDQQVIFMLDCGRRMRHIEEGRDHFDQALNAMLLLAHVASQQGDAVGFLSFGGPHRWLPPRKGIGVVKQLLQQTYDLTSTTQAADYMVAAKELMPLAQRRALVVILTNTRDEDHADLINSVGLLKRRHLVVVANLRESFLNDTLNQTVHDFDTAQKFHAVNEYLVNRRKSLESLRLQGAVTLDLEAPQLPIALVNNYHMIKASGSL